MAMAFTRATYT